ncbi:hypothetical protein H6783_00700 [Candidatus Nomurabacteria bacterium]|nr:hypothetical protein [Candidatus Nomurabacteria bacterium]
MHIKACGGEYDGKHPIAELKKKAKRGDANAKSALLLRAQLGTSDSHEAAKAVQELGL